MGGYVVALGVVIVVLLMLLTAALIAHYRMMRRKEGRDIARANREFFARIRYKGTGG